VRATEVVGVKVGQNDDKQGRGRTIDLCRLEEGAGRQRREAALETLGVAQAVSDGGWRSLPGVTPVELVGHSSLDRGHKCKSQEGKEYGFAQR